MESNDINGIEVNNLSLIPKKKSIENEYRKIMALIIFLIGLTTLLWFLFHWMYVGLTGVDFDFYSTLSLVRIPLGIGLITFGYAMYKFIDIHYDRPYIT